VEEVRRIINDSAEKSIVRFITYAGDGGIVFAVAEPGAAAVKRLQATSRCKSPPSLGVVNLRNHSSL